MCYGCGKCPARNKTSSRHSLSSEKAVSHNSIETDEVRKVVLVALGLIYARIIVFLRSTLQYSSK